MSEILRSNFQEKKDDTYFGFSIYSLWIFHCFNLILRKPCITTHTSVFLLPHRAAQKVTFSFWRTTAIPVVWLIDDRLGSTAVPVDSHVYSVRRPDRAHAPLTAISRIYWSFEWSFQISLVLFCHGALIWLFTRRKSCSDARTFICINWPGSDR